MTVTASKPSLNLRKRLTALSNPPRYTQQQFWFSGDASETDFALPRGWKPFSVFDAGSLQKDGAADEYEVSFDGFIYTVSFAVAPANGNDVCIIGERV